MNLIDFYRKENITNSQYPHAIIVPERQRLNRLYIEYGYLVSYLPHGTPNS